MLDDRDRRELARLERRLRTDDPELVRSFDPRLPARRRPWTGRPVLTTVAAAVVLLLAVLLLGAALTIVLLVAAAVVVWVLDHGDRTGPDGRVGPG